MIEGARHIVSKINWNTAINQKEKAVELQQRISNWTKFHLEREVNKVFDQVCPSNEIWRIQQLNINLEQVDLENLEEELSLQVPRLIHEQLSDFILYRQQNRGNVELIDWKKSQTAIVNTYLEKGILPWWYNSTLTSSLNSIVSDQLKNNKREFIQLLLKIGKKENIRKRLAWQLENTTLQKIVIGVEPVHHQEIINFKTELESFQEKANVLNKGKGELTRHLWFWVLTYLLVERGTFFNKVAYAKSMLFQMADHFNIKRQQLLLLIRQSVKKISLKSAKKTSFLTVIQTILKDEAKLISHAGSTASPDYWERLSLLLQSKKTTEKGETNDLLAYLLRADESRLLELLSKQNNLTKRIYGQLNLSLLEELYSAFVEENKLKKVESYYAAANRLIGKKGKPIERKRFLFYALNQLHQKNFVHLSGFQLLSDYVQHFSIPEKVLLATLKSLEYEHKAEDSSDILFYRDLLQLQTSSLSKPKASISNTLSAILKKIKRNEKEGKEIRRHFVELERALKLNEKDVLEQIKHWKNKEELTQLLALLLKQKNLKELLINSSEVSVFRKIINQLKFGEAEKMSDDLFLIRYEKYSERLMELLLVECLLNKEITKKSTHLLNALFKLQEESLSFELKLVTKLAKAILHETKIDSREPSYRRFRQEIKVRKNQDFREEAESLMSRSHYEGERLGDLIAEELKRSAYTYLKSEFGEEFFQKLVVYLIKDKSYSEITYRMQKLYDELSKENKPLLKNRFQLLFWNSILDVRSHQFSLDNVEQNVKTAIKINAASSKTRADIKESSFPNTKTKEEISTKEYYYNLREQLKNKSSLAKTKELGYQTVVIKLSALPGLGEFLNAALCFHRLIMPFVSARYKTQVEQLFWKHTFTFLASGSNRGLSILHDLVKAVFQYLRIHLNIQPERIALENRDAKTIRTAQLQKALEKQNTLFSLLYAPSKNTVVGKQVDQLHQAGELNKLCEIILKQGLVPSHYNTTHQLSLKELIQTIKLKYPLSLVEALKSVERKDVYALRTNLSFAELISIMALTSHQAAVFNRLTQLFQALGQLRSSKLHAKHLQEFLYFKVLRAWQGNSWKSLSESKLWIELIYDLNLRKQIQSPTILQALDTIKHLFPTAHQLSFDQLHNRQKREATPLIKRTKTAKPKREASSAFILEKQPTILTEAISIQNAGLVMVNSYFTVLFSRLALLQENRFTDDKAQMDAVHILQYLVSGSENTDEALLPLNKVMCGIHPTTPVYKSITLKEENKKVLDGLVEAMIAHWPAIGKSSIDGFRGNWLIRQGILVEYEENWELTVDKKAYDILINKSPFSFSFIKYPWMDKPLKVNWPY